MILFFLRIFICQGWYIVCYALEIYHLNLFIAFLTPKIDPEFDLYGECATVCVCWSILARWNGSCYLQWLCDSFSIRQIIEDQGPELPTRSNQEFRPFIRRLPEFKFWYEITRSIVIGLACTFFEIFNIPVFWPILVMYFITLFCITMKRQIKVSHYMPFGCIQKRLP